MKSYVGSLYQNRCHKQSPEVFVLLLLICHFRDINVCHLAYVTDKWGINPFVYGEKVLKVVYWYYC